MGCFTINYNMLFGFVSAIITYLIILVQFNIIIEERNPISSITTQTTHYKEPQLLNDTQPLFAL